MLFFFFFDLITAKDPGGSTWMGLGDFAKRYPGGKLGAKSEQISWKLGLQVFAKRKLSKYLK